MSAAAWALLAALAGLALFYILSWIRLERVRRPGHPRQARAAGRFRSQSVSSPTSSTPWVSAPSRPPPPSTNCCGWCRDERIPGTLNVGHALPTVAQAFIFIAAVSVDPITLVAMIGAAVLGAWLGSGVVARLPRRAIQLGMGVALLVAAVLFVLGNVGWIPAGGEALGARRRAGSASPWPAISCWAR